MGEKWFGKRKIILVQQAWFLKHDEHESSERNSDFTARMEMCGNVWIDLHSAKHSETRLLWTKIWIQNQKRHEKWTSPCVLAFCSFFMSLCGFEIKFDFALCYSKDKFIFVRSVCRVMNLWFKAFFQFQILIIQS